MKLSYRQRDALGWYLLMFLPILGTIVFSILPLFETAKSSFTNASGAFVGMTNYTILSRDIEFKQGLVNTFYMGLLGVLINIPLSFIIANILNNITRGKNFFKTLFLLPIVMSMVTVALLFQFIFSPDANSVQILSCVC